MSRNFLGCHYNPDLVQVDMLREKKPSSQILTGTKLTLLKQDLTTFLNQCRENTIPDGFSISMDYDWSLNGSRLMTILILKIQKSQHLNAAWV
jgi:hypothetical protein